MQLADNPSINHPMPRFTAIIIAAMLLLGASGLVWLKIGNEDSPPEPSPAARTSTSRFSQRTTAATFRYKALTDDSLAQHTRLDLARSIDTHLSEQETELLLGAFTHTPQSQSNEQWWLVLNEIMEQMRKKGVAADRLGPALTALIKDPKQTEVVRDYAIQHLSQWIAPPSPDTPSEPSPVATADALQAIAFTITDPSIAHTSIPGTALMALTANDEYIAPELTAPVWQKLDPVLTTILKGEVYGSLSTRTTIIQSVALRGSKEHLPLIRQFARDEKADPSMRLSSIAALGIYRSGDDRQYLQQIATGSTRYRYAAQSALKKLSN